MEQNAAEQQQELYHTDMSVGEILRRTRVHYGQSLEDIERALHIRASQLQVIESDDVERLPGRVYAIGFVRSYSEYLGLDGDKMVHLFKKQAGGKTQRPELDFPIAASETHIPPAWVVIGTIVCAVAIIGVWLSIQTRDRTIVTEIPEMPHSEKTEAVIMGPPVPAFAPADEAVEAVAPAQQQGIILKILENSWVEIRNADGEAIVSRVLKAGDRYFVPDRPDLNMALGNAGGVLLQLDGVDMKPFGKTGEIMRDITLDRDYLREHYSEAGAVNAPAGQIQE